MDALTLDSAWRWTRRHLLRTRLESELSIPVHKPPMSLCVDNGAMIAAAGHSRLQHGFTGSLDDTPTPNLPLTDH